MSSKGTTYYITRPIGRGVRGGLLKPPFWPPNNFIHCLAICIALSGPLTSLPMRIIAFQMSLFAAMHPICSWRTSE